MVVEKKDVLYQQLCTLIKEKAISNLDTYEQDNTIVVSNSIINFSTFTYATGLSIGIFLLSTLDEFKVLGLLLSLICLVRLLLSLSPIKTLKLDFDNETLTSSSLIGSKTIVAFKDIKTFLPSISSTLSKLARHEVIVESKAQRNTLLFDVSYEEHAFAIVDLLNRFIKS
ncbi:hypothetical protein SY85_09925 [Flavisolibacter tropicus]|uniref:Uncharacterized protein n=2 Tax=Flavisolibacter tropicus TaxID=1492898 RepID=A0A172TUI1_9BACT|nr:hypothetical protein SY85_09925 [Flavisolibacter tropicus]